MTKLLRANMMRLVKSATFWVCIAVYALYPVAVTAIERPTNYGYFLSDDLLSLNYGGLQGFPLQGILIVFLCSIILNADFHNGALRNKIVLGYSRSSIYFANILTVMIIALALNAVFLLAFFAVGMPLLGNFSLSASAVVGIIVNGTLMMLAYSSIHVFIVMTSKNAVASTVISIVVLAAGAGFAFGMWYIARIPSHIAVDRFNGIGEFIETVTIPWEGYPGKATHDFCQFIADFFPSGQSCQFFFNVRNSEFTYAPLQALYSLIWIVATSGVGIAIFNKVNTK